MTDFVTQIQEKEINKLIDELHWQLNELVRINTDARQRNQELLNEHFKDETLAKLKTERDKAVQDSHRGFPITESELKTINAWRKKHDTEVHNNPQQYHGACGGGYEYSFYPTGIATFGECICTSCKSKAIKEKGAEYYKYLKDELHGIFQFQND